MTVMAMAPAVTRTSPSGGDFREPPGVLIPAHREELRASGLTDETTAALGCYSATAEGVRALLGFGAGPGLIFPYASLNGGPPYCRVKLDKPGRDGKRYRSPLGLGNRVYAPLLLDRRVLTDSSRPIWFAEGEKKTAVACQAGLDCMGLSGVWSWRMRSEDGASIPIPDFEHIEWLGRLVYIVFDSDADPDTSAEVRRAEQGLAHELQRRGARVLSVRLPSGPDGGKVGLDDYLLTHSVEALCALEPVPVQGRVTSLAVVEPPGDAQSLCTNDEIMALIVGGCPEGAESEALPRVASALRGVGWGDPLIRGVLLYPRWAISKSLLRLEPAARQRVLEDVLRRVARATSQGPSVGLSFVLHRQMLAHRLPWLAWAVVTEIQATISPETGLSIITVAALARRLRVDRATVRKSGLRPLLTAKILEMVLLEPRRGKFSRRAFRLRSQADVKSAASFPPLPPELQGWGASAHPYPQVRVKYGGRKWR